MHLLVSLYERKWSKRRLALSVKCTWAFSFVQTRTFHCVCVCVDWHYHRWSLVQDTFVVYLRMRKPSTDDTILIFTWHPVSVLVLVWRQQWVGWQYRLWFIGGLLRFGGKLTSGCRWITFPLSAWCVVIAVVGSAITRHYYIVLIRESNILAAKDNNVDNDDEDGDGDGDDDDDEDDDHPSSDICAEELHRFVLLIDLSLSGA